MHTTCMFFFPALMIGALGVNHTSSELMQVAPNGITGYQRGFPLSNRPSLMHMHKVVMELSYDSWKSLVKNPMKAVSQSRSPHYNLTEGRNTIDPVVFGSRQMRAALELCIYSATVVSQDILT